LGSEIKHRKVQIVHIWGLWCIRKEVGRRNPQGGGNSRKSPNTTPQLFEKRSRNGRSQRPLGLNTGERKPWGVKKVGCSRKTKFELRKTRGKKRNKNVIGKGKKKKMKPTR